MQLLFSYYGLPHYVDYTLAQLVVVFMENKKTLPSKRLISTYKFLPKDVFKNVIAQIKLCDNKT